VLPGYERRDEVGDAVGDGGVVAGVAEDSDIGDPAPAQS
jgi:hypothetical protein